MKLGLKMIVSSTAIAHAPPPAAPFAAPFATHNASPPTSAHFTTSMNKKDKDSSNWEGSQVESRPRPFKIHFPVASYRLAFVAFMSLWWS